MFKNILFATNGSPDCQCAAATAFDLARAHKARLMVVNVTGMPTHGYSPWVRDFKTGQIVSYGPEHTKRALEQLRNLYGGFLDKANKVTLEARAGVPHTEILRLAWQNDADLIILGAHEKPGQDTRPGRTRTVGTTMAAVAQRARCPVLMVTKPCQTLFSSLSDIVFGTDFSVACESGWKLSAKLAGQSGARLHIFHCLDQEPRPAEQEALRSRLAAAKRKIQDHYEPEKTLKGPIFYSVHQGIPHEEILKYARQNKGDLIVLAHHTRKSLDPDQALGSTVEQVVLQADCPVLTVNRPGKLEAFDSLAPMGQEQLNREAPTLH